MKSGRELCSSMKCRLQQHVIYGIRSCTVVLCHWKGSGDCFTDTAQTVCAEHENVSDTSVFQFIQHTQPEFCTLIVSNRNAQYLFMSFLTDPEDHISSVLADDAFAPRTLKTIASMYTMGYTALNGRFCHSSISGRILFVTDVTMASLTSKP